MKSIMVDIETLGTRPGSAIISIGMVAFDGSAITASQGWALDSADWIGDIDPSTVKWWTEQSQAAREYSFNGKLRAMDIVHQISDFVNRYGSDECWANDPDFDVVLLKSWWHKLSERSMLPGRFPIAYRTCRSYRTICAEARRLGISIPAYSGTAHNPVDDAANQARVVMAIRKNLGVVTA